MQLGRKRNGLYRLERKKENHLCLQVKEKIPRNLQKASKLVSLLARVQNMMLMYKNDHISFYMMATNKQNTKFKSQNNL